MSEPDEGLLNPATEDACDHIDACFFSGDSFHSPDAIKRIEFYLGRWQRELASIKRINTAVDTGEQE